MNKKPVIALLANFPLWLADERYAGAGWHCATWLAALYELLGRVDMFEIHWITFRQRGSYRVFEKNGQHIHVLPAYTLNYAQKTHYLHARFLVARELRRIKPDLLHVWGVEGRYAVAGMGYKGRKLLSVQGNLTACLARTVLPPFMVRQAEWERRAYSKYPYFTGESPWSVERIREIAPADAAVYQWEYCVESRFLHALRRMAEQPCCLYAGTDSENKNIRAVLEAFSAPELAHVTLYLAGVEPGRYPNLPSNIKPLGGVSRDGMVRLLEETWCLVHPSFAETGPTVAKEARAVGVPVVISSECGAKQYVEEGKSGHIVNPHDVQGLIRAVLNVTSSREQASAMGEYGRDACRKALNAETMLQGLCAIYARILAQ